MKQQADEADWKRIRTEPRTVYEDIHAQGIGARRLQIIVCPSFCEARAWEVRQLDDEWRLIRYQVVGETPVVQLVGYITVDVDPMTLSGFFQRIKSMSLSLAPHLNDMGGHDGTTVQLALFGDLFSEWRFQWWSEPPEEWRDLVDIASEMIETFEAAEGLSHSPL